MKIKDSIYNYVVRKNKNVQYEYERYVQEHLIEHYEKRVRQWKILWRLNWHYRVRRYSDPLLYWDTSLSSDASATITTTVETKEKDPKPQSGKAPTKNAEKNSNPIGLDSKMSKRPAAYVVAKNLLQYDVISFDIFDTLILRFLEKPSDLFLLLEEKNRIFGFEMLRKKAESEVRANKEALTGSRDVTIYEIYEYISRETGCDIHEMVNQEFAFEKSVCFSNKYMKQIFDILKAQKKRIILVSDMYYPEHMTAELLKFCGIEGYEKLYVSCDYRMSKRKGTLYKKIRQDLGTDLRICHIGDNSDVDITMAKSSGFEAVYYRNVNAIGRERRPKDMSPLIRSVYSGIVNSWIHCSDRLFSPQYEYGFIYGGIYILGYVNWIHEYAKTHHLEKILFLARDSDILKDVYDILFHDIDSEYLYWGRLPSFKYMIEEDLYGFMKRNIQDRINRKSKISIGTLLELLDLQFLKKDLETFNLKENDLLTKENGQLVKAMLLHHISDLKEAYHLESLQAREYVKYVIGEHRNIAIVDIGWKGTEPLCLKRLIQEKWKLADEVRCLMAGSYGNTWNVQDKTFDVYLFSQLHNVNNMNFLKKNISYYTLAFELFGRMRCEARFKGFSSDTGGTKMHFENILVENHEDMQKMRQGIIDFVLEYSKRVKDFPYLMNISGFDAYAPSKTLVRESKILEKYFPNHRIELDAGDNEGNIRTYKNYINENHF